MPKFIDAQEAYRMGLVNKVVPLNQLMSTAKEWAGTICQAAPLGIRASKEAMIRGYDLTLEQGLKLEANVAARVLRHSKDREAGRKAFLEKKQPVFKGE
jgi:enoyl-CoA hydratase/carnithine racemase